MGTCSCDTPVSNLGSPKCTPQIGIILRVAFMPVFKLDGSLNSIDATATLDSTLFDSMQYHSDPFQRLYPLAVDLENVELPKGETKYQTYNSGRKRKIKDGERQFKAIAPEIGTTLTGKIEAMGCSSKVGAFFIDHLGNLIGMERQGQLQKLFPIPIADSTVDAMFDFANDSAVSQTTIMFDFDSQVQDSNLSMIDFNELTSVDLRTQLIGKLDLTISESGVSTTTSFKAMIGLDYGTVKTKVPVKGLVLADFNLYNTSTSLAVTPSSVVESPDGIYTFTIPAQTSGDKIRVGLNATTATKPFDAARFALAANFITL